MPARDSNVTTSTVVKKRGTPSRIPDARGDTCPSHCTLAGFAHAVCESGSVKGGRIAYRPGHRTTIAALLHGPIRPSRLASNSTLLHRVPKSRPGRSAGVDQ